MFGRCGRQLQVVLSALLWVAVAVGPAATVAAATTSTSHNLGPVAYGRLQSGRLVDVRHLGPAAPMNLAAEYPFLTRNPRATSTLKTSANTSSRVASGPPPAAAPRTASTPVEEQLTVFPGISLQQQIAALPNEGRQPPDTQIAVGPGLLMEMDNRTGSFWTKAGVLATTTGPNPFDLQPFFVPSPGPASCPAATCEIFDPRLLYDADSGRWLASVVGLNPATPQSSIFIGISSSSDPTSTWKVFQLLLPAPGSNPSVLADQPTLGVSHDKVTIAWSDFFPSGVAPCPPSCFLGQEAMVLDKAQLLAGAAPATFTYGPNQTQFGFMAVQSLTSSTTAYIVYNNADPTFLVQNQAVPTLGLIAITGTPSAGNVAFNETDLPLASGTTAPPDAVQMGNSRLVSTNDDRLNSATWQNGTLWTSAAIGCGGLGTNNIPNGACLRMWQVSTGAVPALAQDFFLVGAGGGAGDYFYDPAQSVDSLGNMYLVFSHSNAASFPGAMITGQLLGSLAGSLTPLLMLQAGQGPYDPITPGCGTVSRWGDYAAAAQDPTDPTDVWVATEYTPDAGNSCSWGTIVGRLTLSGPSITSATPPSSPRMGGTSIVIRGRDFLPGGTTVAFETFSPTALTVTPDQITTVSPPHLPGSVTLSVSTPNGRASVQITYLPRPEFAPGASGSTSRPARPAPPSVPQIPPGPRPRVAGQPTAPIDSSATAPLNLTPAVWLAIQQAVLRLIGFLL